MNTRDKQAGRRGVVMIIVVSFLTVLVFLGGTIAAMLGVNVRQTGYANAAAQAWQQAEAGADLVFARVREDEMNGTLPWSGTAMSVNYAAPMGYTFDTVTTLTRMPNARQYAYRVTGRSGEARAIIEVVLGRAPGMNLGAFGNQGVTLKPNTYIHSYDSSTTTTPTSSTGAATVGVNGTLSADASAVDGQIYLGESTAGLPASYGNENSTSAEVIRTDWIDPDPLGVDGGALAAWFGFVAATNHNTSAVGGTHSGGQLRITGNVTLTAGNYYVSEINLGNHRTLTVDASAGPVRIFLTGGASTQPNANIVVNPPYARNLQIFSNSSQPITFQPNNSFIGYIYAPLASITVQPNGDIYGALWGNQLSMQPNGSLYIDTDFVNTFDFNQPLRRVAWKRVTQG